MVSTMCFPTRGPGSTLISRILWFFSWVKSGSALGFAYGIKFVFSLIFFPEWNLVRPSAFTYGIKFFSSLVKLIFLIAYWNNIWLLHIKDLGLATFPAPESRTNPDPDPEPKPRRMDNDTSCRLILRFFKSRNCPQHPLNYTDIVWQSA